MPGITTRSDFGFGGKAGFEAGDIGIGLADLGDRIAIMLHNGKAEPQKTSEIAWLDRDWRLIERQPLPEHSCHDIVADEQGVL